MDSYYQTRYTFDPARTTVWKEIVRFEASFIPATGTVLDVGAGYCDFINNVTATRRIAADISPELSKYAAPGVEQLSAPADDMSSVASGSVDVVHASNLLEHFDDVSLERVIAEFARVLKTGGRLILQQPNFAYSGSAYFDDPTHKKVFTHVSLKNFVESHGFKVVLLRPKFLPFSMNSRPSIVPVSSLVVRAYIASPWKPFAGQMLCIAEKL